MTTRDALEPVIDARRTFLEDMASMRPGAQKVALGFMASQADREERVRQGHPGRYPVELLQNAHDASAEAGRPGAVHFWLTEHALLVANEGVAFDQEHIESLVALGLSEKTVTAGRRKTIGYKGIGFSSVFEISDRPEIITSDFAFSFDGDRARRLVSDSLGRDIELVPIRAFPFRIDREKMATDRTSIERLFEAGAVTVIRLPFRSDGLHDLVRATLGESLAPEILLFSPFLRELAITVEGETSRWKRTSARKHGSGRLVFLQPDSGERRAWLVAEGTVPVSAAVVGELRDRLWKDVRELGYGVALPWDRGIDATTRPQPLHVYYPTEDRVDRAVLVHGDFYVTEDRRRIESSGPQGVVSNLVAVAAAETLAELAESVAKTQGADLLRALAPSGEGQGFGRVMGEALDAALRKARIARTTTGVVRQPEGLFVFDTQGLDNSTLDEFARMFGRQADLLDVNDGDAVTISYLASLAAVVLRPEDTAQRLRHTPASRYPPRVAALSEWLATLVQRAPTHVTSTIAVLRQAPILVDSAGRSTRPERSVLRIGDVPSLPTKLQKSEVKVPRVSGASAFLEQLRVEELDLESALTLVLNAVTGGFGREDEDGKEVLRFVRNAWDRNHSLVERNPSRGLVRVPAKMATGKSAVWRSARDVYFGKSWTGNDNVERLYGQFGEHEFLAEQPPKRASRQARSFFRALEVKELPGMQTYKLDWFGMSSPPGVIEWRRSVDPELHGACDEHPQSQHVEFDVVDRLDDLLITDRDSLTLKRATALASLLTKSGDALGPQARIVCTNTQHRRHRVRRVEGYQGWLLRTASWIPSRDPGASKNRLSRPIWAWRGVTRSFSSFALTQAVLTRSVADRLPLPSTGNPPVDALEHLLIELNREHTDLANASQSVQKTARWAQQQLDRQLRRYAPRVLRFQLVAEMDGSLCWSDRPLVPDVPGARQIPGVPIVSGRSSNLERVYGLPTAREALSIEVVPGRRVRASLYLNQEVRAAILAFLDSQAVDRDQVATRLARLRERPVAQIALKIRYGENEISITPLAYLDIQRNKVDAIRGATLFWAPDLRAEISTLSLAEELAFYFAEPDQADPLALLLSKPGDFLDREQITDHDLELAVAALAAAARRSRIDQEERADVESPDEAEGLDDEPEESMAEEESDRSAMDESSSDGEVDPEARESSTPDVTGNGDVGDGDGSGGSETADRVRDALKNFGRPPPPDSTGDGEADGGTSPWLAGEIEFAPPAPPGQQPPKRRKRSGDGGGAGGPGGRGGGFVDADRQAERDAVEVVKRYSSSFGAVVVRDVQDKNLGWDLEFVMPDGHIVPVEVKGSRRDTAFMITRNERRNAVTPEYILLWVANLHNPNHMVIRRFRDLATELTDDHLEALSWIVEGWPSLTYDEVPVRVATPVKAPTGS